MAGPRTHVLIAALWRFSASLARRPSFTSTSSA